MTAGTVGFPSFTWPITGGVSGDHGYVRFIRENYLDGIRLKVMQLQSLLSKTTMETIPTFGAPLYIDAVKKINPSGGAAPAVQKNRARFAALVKGTTPTERRALYPNFYDYSEDYDWRDQHATMRAVQPGSAYIQVVRGAFAVDADALFVAALDGAVFISDPDSVQATINQPISRTFAQDGGTDMNVAYPFLNTDVWTTIVEPKYGNDSSGRNPGFRVAGLTSEKVNGGLRLLRQTFAVMPGERIFLACHPIQGEQLANDVRVISRDFNALESVKAGLPGDYNGVHIIPTPAIAAAAAGATDPFALETSWPGDGNTGHYAYLYTQSAMGWGEGTTRSEFDIIPENGHKFQMAHYQEFSSVRLDGAKIIRIECADGVTT